MKQLRKFLFFLIYSNLFVAACTTLMVQQTCQLLLHERANSDYAGFVFFSTLCSYSFHWYLTFDSVIPSGRITWLDRYRFIHVLLFFTGLAGAAFFFFRLFIYWYWLILAAIPTFLYSAPKIPHPLFRLLRKVAIGKTIFLAFIWMYVTTILPVIIAGRESNTGFVLFAISRFFLIYSVCILFDYRDRPDDKAAGVRSLITYLSEKNITRLFTFSLLIFSTSTGGMLAYGYGLTDIILILIPGIIIASLYNYSHRNFSDLLYYFILDGLLAFSAVLMLIPGI